MEALAWPQRPHYNKLPWCLRNRSKYPRAQGIVRLRGAENCSALFKTPVIAAHGLKRNFDNALPCAVHGFLVRRWNRRVPGGRGGGGGADLALFQGSAGLFPAPGL